MVNSQRIATAERQLLTLRQKRYNADEYVSKRFA
jgi:hypothetical protein